MKCRLIASMGFLTAVALLGFNLSSDYGLGSGAKRRAIKPLYKNVTPQASMPPVYYDELIPVERTNRDWRAQGTELRMLDSEELTGAQTVER